MDGNRLVGRLVEQIERDPPPEHLPVVLYLLFATPGFKNYQRFLTGIHAAFEKKGMARNAPLLGCSISASITNHGFSTTGAALVALHSDAVRVIKTAAVEMAATPDATGKNLARELGLTRRSHDFNPNDNFVTMMFLPGFRKATGRFPDYWDTDIHRSFCQQTNYEIPTIGGSGADRPGQRKEAWQFREGTAHRNCAVAGLLECDLQFGQAMAAGLAETPKFVVAEDHAVSQDGKAVTSFQMDGKSWPAKELISKFRGRGVFGVRNDDGDPSIYFPLPIGEGDSVIFLRGVRGHRRLQLFLHDHDRTAKTACDIVARSCQRAGLSPGSLAGMLGFICSGRLSAAIKDVKRFEKTYQRFTKELKGKPLVAVYLNGECGLDSTGRPVHNNMQVSCTVCGKGLTMAAQMRHANRALASAGRAMLHATSVDTTMEAALAGLQEAGLAGGMISLVYHDTSTTEETICVVARKALPKWEKLKETTRRRFRDNDILAEVYRTREYFYVADSRTAPNCDQQAARDANVISQFVAPLISEGEHVVGTIQVDLGDRSQQRELEEWLFTFLKAYANEVGAAVSRAMFDESLEIARGLDRAVSNAMVHDNEKDAVKSFLHEAVPLLHADMGHVRVLSSDSQHLVFLDGVGEYAQAVMADGRLEISVNDTGASAVCFREFDRDRAMVINDATHDDRTKKFRRELGQRSLAGTLAARIGSSANLVLYDSSARKKIGVLNIASFAPWLFADHMVRALLDFGVRLGLLIATARVKQETRKANLALVGSNEKLGLALSELHFLRAALPTAPIGERLQTGLDMVAGRLQGAENAQIVSIFLWDADRKALVLAAQRGWYRGAVGKAVYCEDEGMTGHLITTADVIVEPDRATLKTRMGVPRPKYEYEMFGGIKEGEVIEVIAFRLFAFSKVLGAVVMHNRRTGQDKDPSLFAVTNCDTLRQLQAGLSMHVYGLLAFEEESRMRREEECLAHLVQDLMLPDSSLGALNNALRGICQRREIEAMGVFMAEGRLLSETLRLAADYGHPETLRNPPVVFERGRSLLFEAFDLQRPVARHRRPNMPPIPLLYLDRFVKALPSHDVRSYLVLPLCFAGQKLGVVSFLNIRSQTEESAQFTSADIAFLVRVADAISIFIWTKRLEKQKGEMWESRERLLHSLATMGRAAIALAHPIFQPLCNIKALCSTFVREHRDNPLCPLFEEIEGYAHQVMQRQNRFRRFVGGYKTRQKKQRLLASNLSRIQVEAIRPRCAHTTVSIDDSCSSDFALAVVGRGIQDVLETVMNNAVDAMPNGGRLSIRIDYDRDSKTGRITVDDTGCGMSAETLRRALHGFYTTKQDGFGLGLLLAQEVLQRNGAKLHVTSEEGKGTHVEMSFPDAEEIQK